MIYDSLPDLLQSVSKEDFYKRKEQNHPINTKVALEDCPLGNAYFKTIKYGPYVRYSNTQERHYEEGLIQWMKNTTKEEQEQVGDETSEKGNILHRYFEFIVNNEDFTIEEKNRWALEPCKKFKEFVDQQKVKPLHTELKMVSDVLGIGGTVDFVGTFDGRYVVADWKTGGVYESYKCQLAIYLFMLFENKVITNPEVFDLAICQFHRDGKKHSIKWVTDWQMYLKGALNTFERWKLDNKDKLLWLLAPQAVLDERKKTRGDARVQFLKKEWKLDYAWPWLFRDSVLDARNFLQRRT